MGSTMEFDPSLPIIAATEQDIAPPSPLSNATSFSGDEGYERQRLAALHRLGLMDSEPEPEFDELVQLAAAICETPVCMVTLLDEKRQWFKASIGIKARETTREVAFCNYTIQQPGVLEVSDATDDPRFANNPLVTEGERYRFYAGIPVHTPEGYPLGSLCVLDCVPRKLTTLQLTALRLLGRQVNARLELREQRLALKAALQTTETARAELARSDARFQAFMDSAPFMSYIKDAEGHFVFYNQLLSERFGISREDWIGKTVEDLFPADTADAYRRNDLEVMRTGRLFLAPEFVYSEDGTRTQWNSYKFPCGDDRNFMLGGISVDVTDSIHKQEELHRYQIELEYANSLLREQATTDTLTGLPNRRAIQERLAHDFGLARRNRAPLSVLLLDVDNFKQCNDTHGHDAGDQTLRHLANILRHTLRQTDLVARYGGEEFMLILPDTNQADAGLLADRLLAALAKTTWPVEQMTISGGIATLTPEITTQERLVSLADQALYLAKRSGKNRILPHSSPQITTPEGQL
jgi:diguanylate cyclase (GGDEF)-like protein/PAS domain S-box-containing protein